MFGHCAVTAIVLVLSPHPKKFSSQGEDPPIFCDQNEAFSANAQALEERTVMVSAHGSTQTTTDKVVLWDLMTGRIIARVDEPLNSKERAKLYRDEKRISTIKASWGLPDLGMLFLRMCTSKGKASLLPVVGGGEEELRKWNIDESAGKNFVDHDVGNLSTSIVAALSPDGLSLVTGSTHSELKAFLWNTAKNAESQTPK